MHIDSSTVVTRLSLLALVTSMISWTRNAVLTPSFSSSDQPNWRWLSSWIRALRCRRPALRQSRWSIRVRLSQLLLLTTAAVAPFSVPRFVTSAGRRPAGHPTGSPSGRRCLASSPRRLSSRVLARGTTAGGVPGGTLLDHSASRLGAGCLGSFGQVIRLGFHPWGRDVCFLRNDCRGMSVRVFGRVEPSVESDEVVVLVELALCQLWWVDRLGLERTEVGQGLSS